MSEGPGNAHEFKRAISNTEQQVSTAGVREGHDVLGDFKPFALRLVKQLFEVNERILLAIAE